MRSILAILVLPLFFNQTIIAQPALEKTLLWEVTGNNILTPSYLFGTIHLMCPNDLAIDKTVEQKFSSTNELFLEIKTDDPNMMMEMMKGIRMKDTSTIKGLTGPNNYDSISKIFKRSTGMPLDMLNHAKPILIISMIYPFILGCSPDSWEKTFEKLAKEKKMPLKGLEKLSDQLGVLENIPYKKQAEMMMKMMYNLDSARAVFDEMLAVYKKKDVAALYEMTTSDGDFGQYEGNLLVDRNKKWIPVIEEQAAKTATFFAFGAAHLGGNNGVINLLRNKGYSVKPVLY